MRGVRGRSERPAGYQVRRGTGQGMGRSSATRQVGAPRGLGPGRARAILDALQGLVARRASGAARQGRGRGALIWWTRCAVAWFVARARARGGGWALVHWDGASGGPGGGARGSAAAG